MLVCFVHQISFRAAWWYRLKTAQFQQEIPRSKSNAGLGMISNGCFCVCPIMDWQQVQPLPHFYVIDCRRQAPAVLLPYKDEAVVENRWYE